MLASLGHEELRKEKKFIKKFIIWLAPRAGKMTQIAL